MRSCINVEEDVVTIEDMPYAGIKDGYQKLKLFGGVTNGDCMSIFKENLYQSLPIKGNVIIDIGANIADSSIYFARGKRKVIGLEPFPNTYDIAKKKYRREQLYEYGNTGISGLCGP
jgi:hypothetical protein